MSTSYLTLPFASTGTERKTEFSNDMELAAMICAAETERRKSPVSAHRNDLTFVSKLYYPVWAIPWGKNSIMLDGMKQITDTILVLKPPDLEAFIDNLKRNTKDQEQYSSTLRSERQTFTQFSSRKQIPITGYITRKEILSDVTDFLKDTKAITKSSAPRSNSFIQPRIDEENAIEISNEILACYDKLQSAIKGLQYALQAVTEETQAQANMLQQELQQVQQDFNQQIADLSRIVSEKTAQLENERNSEIERMTANNNKKISNVLAEKQELEKQLLKLEQDRNEYEKRKELRKLKKDKPGEVRWKVRLQQVKKQISKEKGRIKSLSNLIAKTEKETEKTMKKLTAGYDRLIGEEKMKIVDLGKSRDLKIGEKNEDIEELQQNTLGVTRNIESLIEQTKSASSRIEEAKIPWETENPTVIGIPLYVIRPEVGNENRYILFPPVIAQGYKGIVMRFSTTIGVLSLGSRINSLLKPRSKSIEELFNSLRKELENDRQLQTTINQIGKSNNLTTVTHFGERLRKGLKELEDEGWIKPKEKEAVLGAYRST